MSQQHCNGCGKAIPSGETAELCHGCRSGIGGASELVDERTETFVDGDSGTAPFPAWSYREQAGTVIGNYKLIEVIGEGGFGTVWMAQQGKPVYRRVALKIVKLGMDTREVVARFEAERQALALMEHTNIAKVLDGGTTEHGRPYFVMELVKGVRITDYCDAKRLGTKERLELFISVCLAVQHAHQKGVIHRDLKPSNILVTEQDGLPIPKVIDFGIAKAMGPRLTDHSVYTRLHQVIGTPAYMSPEQAGLGRLDIDTRSDVFSLGVVLYELLTGRTPFRQEDFLQAGMDEIFRLIREVDPPKPSTRLSTLGPDELIAVASNRRMEPRRLGRLVRGELDWIVMRCLEKDRARRYETASGLAGDLRRYLDDEPVQAAPPAAVYRLRKAVRQHRQLFAAAGFALVVFAIGAGIATMSYLRERAARLRADASEQRTVRNAYAVAMQAVSMNRDGIGRKDLSGLLDGSSGNPELGFEWYFWQRVLHSERLAIQDYPEFVPPVLFHEQDGQILGGVRYAKAGAMQWQAAIAWWDASSGAESRVFEVGDRMPGGIRPDQLFEVGMGGVELAVADRSAGRITRHVTKTALELGQVDTKPRGLAAFAYAGTNLLLALESPETRTLVVRNAAAATEVPVFEDLLNFERVGFSPNGNLIARWGTGGLRPLEVGRLTPVYRRLFRAENQFVTVAAFSTGESVLATGNDKGELLQWDLAATNPVPVLIGSHSAPVQAIAYSTDEKLVASGDKAGLLKIWRIGDNHNTATFAAHEGSIEHLAFSADGTQLLSIGRNSSGFQSDALRIWEVTERSEFQVIATNSTQVTAVCFSPDNRSLLVGSADGAIWLRDLVGPHEQLIAKLPRAITWVAFSPEGNQVAAGTSGGNISSGFTARVGDVFESRVWESATGAEVARFHTSRSDGDRICFSPDGKWLARMNDDSSVMFRDRKSGNAVNSTPLSTRVFSMEFTASGDRLRFLNGRWEVMELVPEKGSIPTPRTWQNGVVLINGGAMAIGDHERIAKDTSTVEFTKLIGRATSAEHVAYDSGYRMSLSADANRLVVIESGGIKIRDTRSGNWLLDLRVPRSEMARVAFSPSGLLVAGADTSGRILLWRAATEEQVAGWARHAEEASIKRRSRSP